MPNVDAVRLVRVSVPLHTPYHLSSITLDTFDTLFAEVTCSDGTVGVGETTTLAGYSSETADEAWANVRQAGIELVGADVDVARERLDQSLLDAPFSRSSLSCAIETAGSPVDRDIEAPLVGILSTSEELDVARKRLVSQLQQGYETIKVKIGFDPVIDADRLTALAEHTPDSVAFRVDANQAYDYEDAVTFLTRAPLDRLQVVEQPLPTGRLDDHAALHADFEATIMLDEEIETATDLDRVIENRAAGAVKFKLMKHGSLAQTDSLVRRAQNAGFDVVLGNGVQSDVGCLLEASLWARHDLSLAGEFNGWLKQVRPALRKSPRFDDGALVWNGTSPTLSSLDTDFRTDSAEFVG